MTSDASQISLSEELWLLKILRFPAKVVFRGHRDTTTLRALNTVALFLATDQPDGVFATFYHHSSSTLYIAKSGVVTTEDTAALNRLVNALETARGYEDLLPFLAQRGAAKVNKRIRKLRESLEHIFPTTEDLQERATYYKPGPDSTAEFNQYWLKLFLGSRVSKSTAQTLQMIVEECQSCFISDAPFDESTEACDNFRRLMVAAKTLLGSRCLNMFWGQYSSKHNLVRHLEKISMYLNAKLVIDFWRRDGPKINIQWIRDVGPELPQVMLNTALGANRRLDTILGAFPDSEDVITNFRVRMVQHMDKAYPHWRGEEGSPPIPVTPTVHAEIRIILHLMASVNSEEQELLIGCSQRTCLCCTFWMDTFNNANDTYWTTARGTDFPRYEWAFPDHPSVGLEAMVECVADKTQVVIQQHIWEVIYKKC